MPVLVGNEIPVPLMATRSNPAVVVAHSPTTTDSHDRAGDSPTALDESLDLAKFVNRDAAAQPITRPLAIAICNGDLLTVRELLSQWPTQPHSQLANSAPKPSLWWPFTFALYSAVENDNPEIVSHVLGLGIPVDSLCVLKALDAQSADIFRAFQNHGWDINSSHGQNYPPPLAYVLKNEQLTRWFLDHGASPSAPSPGMARTPAMFAAAGAPLHIVRLLCPRGATYHDVLQSAAESSAEGRLEVMEYLLDGGADIDAVKWKHHAYSYQNFGMLGLGTALHYAARCGFTDRVEMLLRRGARVDVADSNGLTALEVARDARQGGVVALLSGV